MCKEELVSGVEKFIFPQYFSQSFINGRFGSNACSVITLVNGACITTHQYNEMASIFKCFVGAVGIGKIIYEDNGCDGNLSAEEAHSLLPSKLTFELGMEDNHNATNDFSSMIRLFDRAIALSAMEFLVVVCNSKTSSICKLGNRICFF